MSQHAASHRHDLAAIAHRAMLERGFAPDFAPEVLAEVDALDPHAAGGDGAVRDLTGLPWFSIDNDDSRDLDQVSASERLPGGSGQGARRDRGRRRPRRRRLEGGRPRPDEHDVDLHGGRHVPDAPRAALLRPDLAERGRGPPRARRRDGGRARRRRHELRA